MKRLDDINRTERYFTSTLFGGLLLHADTQGVTRFLEWLIENEEVKLNVVENSKISFPLVLSPIVPEHIEVITELNIKRDLKYYNQTDGIVASDFSDKQNVPDVVIVYGETLIVIEGKFFVTSQSAKDIDAQLLLQKEEINLMIKYYDGGIKYWSHIYLGPDKEIQLQNCDSILDWNDIEQFSKDLLGQEHYITQRLYFANKRYMDFTQSIPGNNYSGKCSYTEIVALCSKEKSDILVGFSGGLNKLRKTSMEELSIRRFKYDFKNNLHGKKTSSNWINGNVFLDIISQMSYIQI
jgi:hypothetical protein